MSRKVMMQREVDDVGIYSLATFQTLRLEALDLFDRSLADGNPEYLERFIQQQVAQEMAPLELLSQVAEDVHQRLLKLRQQHFDARDELRQNLLYQFGFDLTPFLPADPVEYHRMNLEAALSFYSVQSHVTDEIHANLTRRLREAQVSAAELYQVVMLADELYTYLTDWLMALHIVSVRGAWADDLRDNHPLFVQ